MDVGIGNRVAPVGVVTVARSDVIATQGSVPVDLPPEQTVQSAQAGEAVRVDIRERQVREETRRDDAAAARRVADDGQARRRDEQALRDVIDRRLVIEPRTRTLVLQSTNRDTGETIALVPDEATLRRRIMARAMADRVREFEVTARYVERTA